MTKKEVAKMFNVSTKTIERYVNKFDLPCTKSTLNGHVYFDKEEVERWAKEKGLPIGNQG